MRLNRRSAPLWRFILSAWAGGLLGRAQTMVNTTFHDYDQAITYLPDGEWLHWAPNGCLDSNGGQYTRQVGATINFRFTGVAVYAFGLFDDYQVLPIWDVSIDGEQAESFGRNGILEINKCQPIYSKTGLENKEHSLVMTMSGQRPDMIRKLSFDGFLVTAPDGQDPENFSGISDYTEASRTSSSADSTNTNVNSNNGDAETKGKIGTPIIAGIAAAIVVILILLGIIFCLVRKKRQTAPRFEGAGGAGSAEKTAATYSTVPLASPGPNSRPLSQGPYHPLPSPNPGQVPWASSQPPNHHLSPHPPYQPITTMTTHPAWAQPAPTTTPSPIPSSHNSTMYNSASHYYSAPAFSPPPPPVHPLTTEPTYAPPKAANVSELHAQTVLMKKEMDLVGSPVHRGEQVEGTSSGNKVTSPPAYTELDSSRL